MSKPVDIAELSSTKLTYPRITRHLRHEEMRSSGWVIASKRFQATWRSNIQAPCKVLISLDEMPVHSGHAHAEGGILEDSAERASLARSCRSSCLRSVMSRRMLEWHHSPARLRLKTRSGSELAPILAQAEIFRAREASRFPELLGKHLQSLVTIWGDSMAMCRRWPRGQ